MRHVPTYLALVAAFAGLLAAFSVGDRTQGASTDREPPAGAYALWVAR